MVHKLLKTGLVFFSTILFFFSASAADQAPFNADELDKFLNDLPEIPGMTANTSQNMEALRQNGTIDQGWMKQRQQGAVDVIQEKGWDEERFYYIFGHVMMVTSLEHLNRMTKSVAPQMAEAMQALQNNPNMTDEMKKQMMQPMGQGMAGANEDLKKMRAQVKKTVPPSERRLTQSRYSEICSIVGLPENMQETMQQN